MILKWKKDTSIGHTTTIEGFKVDRVTCNSGVRHYYLHRRGPLGQYLGMSDKMRSLHQVRRAISNLKGSN